MGQRVHRMGRSTTRTEARGGAMLADKALATSHFHELGSRARLLALRLQFE